ncbi:MAG: PEP-CTERM sorting domain-containing protein [Bryobacterales bacterium]|nr:PEP-CTERM sorting domain-containing protein [Bryobacterales bacterium]
MMRTLVLGWMLSCGAMLEGAAILSVDPAPVTAAVGQSFQVGVVLSGAPDLVAFQFDVLFPTFLSLDSVVEAGYFAANGVFFVPGVTGVGTVTGISDVLIAPGAPDPDTLVTLHFTALAEGTGTIGFANVLLLDSNFSEVELGEMGTGDVTVETAPVQVVPEPGSLLLLGCGLLLGLLKR